MDTYVDPQRPTVAYIGSEFFAEVKPGQWKLVGWSITGEGGTAPDEQHEVERARGARRRRQCPGRTGRGGVQRHRTDGVVGSCVRGTDGRSPSRGRGLVRRGARRLGGVGASCAHAVRATAAEDDSRGVALTIRKLGGR